MCVLFVYFYCVLLLARISASALGKKAFVQLFEKQSNSTFNVCEESVFAAGALSELCVEVRRVGSHLGPLRSINTCV